MGVHLRMMVVSCETTAANSLGATHSVVQEPPVTKVNRSELENTECPQYLATRTKYLVHFCKPESVSVVCEVLEVSQCDVSLTGL